MNPELSIIVSVYNVEKYLPRCIDSILAQTFTEFEVLLVNDGSYDNCPQICDDYARLDSRIKVIHKPNGGVSDARNKAMLKARGKYIAFVDGDDFIVPEAYEKLIREMRLHNLDILTGRCCRLLEGDIKRVRSNKRTFENIVYSGTEFFCRSVQQGVMRTACWLSIYNKNFLLDNNLFFKEGILHEDELWIPQVFCQAQRVKYIDFVFYTYVWRPNSLTNPEDKTQNGIDLMNICYELELLYAQIRNIRQRKVLNDFLLSTFLQAIYLGRLYRLEYRHLINKKFVLGKALTLKNKFKAGIFLMSPKIYVQAANFKYTIGS